MCLEACRLITGPELCQNSCIDLQGITDQKELSSEMIFGRVAHPSSVSQQKTKKISQTGTSISWVDDG